MSAGRLLILVVLAVGVAGALAVALQVDDWGRDFTTNVAETAEGARDSLLRPMTVDLPLDAATGQRPP